MNAEYSRELLRNGIIEAKSGNKDAARRYLDRAIYMASSYDVLAEAWFWMGEILTDPAERLKAYENCLSHDLRHARARRSLALLEGKLKAEEVVNPDQLPPAPQGLRTADAQRFMCPKCGGRMSFAPDGSNALVCDYCSRSQTLGSGSVNEKDFVVAMATMKGHGRPLQEQVFHCNGCGSEFILPPKQISAVCAYCSSPYVVSLEKEKDLLAPDGVIPHAFDQRRAIKLLIEWVEGNGIQPEKQVDLPRGLYLPLWTFDVGGAIDYTAEVVEYEEDPLGRGRQCKVTLVKDSYPVLVDDWPLPASRKPSSVFLKLIPTFDLKQIQTYDPRVLSDWPAEIYDVPMADASLDARSQTYKKYQKEIPYILGLNTKLVSSSSAGLMVDSFKLNLLPVWMTEIPFDGREHLVLINGQNGTVASDISDKKLNSKNGEESEQGGLMDFLADLLKD
jgi:tetratricopeptide (TPR) repeat protein